MEVGRNLPTENKCRAEVGGGIVSTSRGISAKFVGGMGSPAITKGVRKNMTAPRKLKSDRRWAAKIL